MAVHPLQGSSHDSFFRSGNIKRMPVELHDQTPIDEAISQPDMFAHLTETAYMHLDRFAQAGYRKIGFVGYAVAPASRFDPGIEFPGENAHDLGTFAGGKQIEIISKIRPVVQTLH